VKPEKQVDRTHYEFSRYMSKARWASVWHQLDEIQKLQPENVLEIGPGSGLFKIVANVFGVSVETLDLDPELKPDHVGSITEIPLVDRSYDVVCAFQVLEHLPYEQSCRAFAEMVRVSRRHVVISLPDAKTVWPYRIHFPKLGVREFLVPRPRIRPLAHEFDGEHYWELEKTGYPLSRIIADFTQMARLVTCYRVYENPYHRFFVFTLFMPQMTAPDVSVVIPAYRAESTLLGLSGLFFLKRTSTPRFWSSRTAYSTAPARSSRRFLESI